MVTHGSYRVKDQKEIILTRVTGNMLSSNQKNSGDSQLVLKPLLIVKTIYKDLITIAISISCPRLQICSKPCHNFSFSDDMPPGQTPHTIMLFSHNDLVDAVQPGDRYIVKEQLSHYAQILKESHVTVSLVIFCPENNYP